MKSGKAFRYKWVFRRDLKMGSDSLNLISSGKSFQSFGARMEKALSPLVLSLDTGRNSSLLPEDLRLRDST